MAANTLQGVPGLAPREELICFVAGLPGVGAGEAHLFVLYGVEDLKLAAGAVVVHQKLPAAIANREIGD